MLFHNPGVAFWAAVMRAEVRAARAAVTVGYALASTQMNQEALRAALQEGLLREPLEEEEGLKVMASHTF